MCYQKPDSQSLFSFLLAHHNMDLGAVQLSQSGNQGLSVGFHLPLLSATTLVDHSLCFDVCSPISMPLPLIFSYVHSFNTTWPLSLNSSLVCSFNKYLLSTCYVLGTT